MHRAVVLLRRQNIEIREPVGDLSRSSKRNQDRSRTGCDESMRTVDVKRIASVEPPLAAHVTVDRRIVLVRKMAGGGRIQGISPFELPIGKTRNREVGIRLVDFPAR